jgi:uncharacterized protein
MSVFVIDLATLKPGVNRLRIEGDALELDLPREQWGSPVQGDISVERTGEQVSVRGRLDTVIRLECVRCLRSFELPIQPQLELFAERTGTGERRDEEALERDSYMTFHDGRRLDLRNEVRELLLLELPIAPTCRTDCRGLCTRCGADLNDGPCSCQ